MTVLERSLVTSTRRRSSAKIVALVPPLVAWLTIAALAELLILRTFTRVAIHIPAIDAMAGPYTALAEAGRFAYYTAVVLVIASLAVMGLAAWRSGTVLGQLAAVAVVAIAVPAALLRAGPGLGESAPMNTIMLAAVGLAAVVAAVAWRSGPAVIPAVLGAAIVLSGWHSVSQGWTALGVDLPNSLLTLDAAEYLAAGVAVASPWLVAGGISRRAALAGGVAVLLALVTFGGNPATTRFLLLWSHGLTGSLPSVVYAAAAGGYTAAVVMLFSRGRPLAGMGLILLALGGIGIQNTYQTALILAGLLAFALAAPREQPAADNIAA
jgi:hypothetical protein